MIEFLPWLAGLVVVAAVVFYVWHALREPRKTIAPEDRYHHALEVWLDGDLPGATSMLQDLIHDHPASVDPYLQLGTLLRIQGDPGRAAILHRGLTIRPELSRSKKVSVGLALAEDLLDLKLWDEAKDVLDTLVRDASSKTRYWKGRFRHWHGADNQPEAARALKHGMKAVPEADRLWFIQAYASYQLDRALQDVRKGQYGDASSRLKDVKGIPVAVSRQNLVRAMLAAADNNPAEALTVAAENLLESPHELSLFLPMLQHVLLESGQYSRTVPVLERACQAEHAPPSLWIDLALLYEKLGERPKALRLLESKTGRGDFTPNEAAPYLRLLVKDNPDADFSRIWQVLDMPTETQSWYCSECGHQEKNIRWFCEQCHAFDSFLPGPDKAEAL